MDETLNTLSFGDETLYPLSSGDETLYPPLSGDETLEVRLMKGSEDVDCCVNGRVVEKNRTPGKLGDDEPRTNRTSSPPTLNHPTGPKCQIIDACDCPTGGDCVISGYSDDCFNSADRGDDGTGGPSDAVSECLSDGVSDMSDEMKASDETLRERIYYSTDYSSSFRKLFN